MTEAIRQGDIPGVQLRCRKILGVSPGGAWPWLAEPELLERWIADTVTLDESGGLRLRARTDEGEIEETAERVSQEPGERCTYAFERLGEGWPAKTRLTFELFETPGGSEVSVLHEGFQNLPLSVCLTVWEAYRRRWRAALEGLAAALAE